MFDSIMKFFKKFKKSEKEESKSTAKERLHLVLAQDRANISADFLEMMKQEIIEVIKKYIDIDEKAIDVRLTNKEGEDGTVGAPALYANIPIITIKNEARKLEGSVKKENEVEKKESKTETKENVEKEMATKADISDEEKIDNNEDTNSDQVENRVQENVELDVKKEKDDLNKGQEDNNILNEVNNEEKNS